MLVGFKSSQYPVDNKGQPYVNLNSTRPVQAIAMGEEVISLQAEVKRKAKPSDIARIESAVRSEDSLSGE